MKRKLKQTFLEEKEESNKRRKLEPNKKKDIFDEFNALVTSPLENKEDKVITFTVHQKDVVGPGILFRLTLDTTFVSMSRDEIAKREEDKGSIEFEVIRNDGSIKNLELLLAVKNIFSR
jgi:hypothetical protein